MCYDLPLMGLTTTGASRPLGGAESTHLFSFCSPLGGGCWHADRALHAADVSSSESLLLGLWILAMVVFSFECVTS